MIVYDYKVVKQESIVALATPPVGDDSYLARSQELDLVRSLLSQGYRWVRTDGEYAVLELGIEIWEE